MTGVYLHTVTSSFTRRSSPPFPLPLFIDERISEPDTCCFLLRSGRRLFPSFTSQIMRFTPPFPLSTPLAGSGFVVASVVFRACADWFFLLGKESRCVGELSGTTQG